ncbi:CidA/LrgA family protein [Peribacillus sp. NPDC097295]|uniref:CidA/LrgA family protein n=1 Tax=Peribacillus sp. NPDC097295 TaxID=3364402 RepID=UPI0037F9B05E
MKKTLIFIMQLSLLLIICELGIHLSDFCNLPIPGSVIGMLILFILLQTKILKVEWVDITASFLVKHLAFFFIPISVSLMTMGWLFLKYGLPLALTLLISLIIGFSISAWVVQKLSRREEVKQHDNAHNTL